MHSYRSRIYVQEIFLCHVVAENFHACVGLERFAVDWVRVQYQPAMGRIFLLVFHFPRHNKVYVLSMFVFEGLTHRGHLVKTPAFRRNILFPSSVPVG